VVFFILQNQVDTRDQAVFDKLDQAVEHSRFAGEMTVQRRFRHAHRGGQFRGGDALTAIAGFKHQSQRLKYFFATIPFRSLFFCHVTKYP